MLLVSVNGSPRGRASGTARIGEWLFGACKEKGAEIETFDLADLDIRHCTACGSCLNTGACPITDDVGRVHERLLAADLVVFASPTHVFHVSSQMKAFIDRTMAFFHRPPFEGKYCAVVTSSAGMGESYVIDYLRGCLEMLGGAYVGEVWGTYRPPTRLWEADRVRARAERLGRELVDSATERRSYPLTDGTIARRRFLRELIVHNRKIFKEDYAYWRERGWLDALPGTQPYGARLREE